MNLLPCVELNSQAEQSILFIHGAFGHQRDWDMVTPYLDNYHLILPDLPGHGQAVSTPFNIESSVEKLRKLIAARAHEGVAHVVGFSLGAKIAVQLVSRFPEIVKDRQAVVTGFGAFDPDKTSKYLPQIAWTATRIEWAMPRAVVRWLMDGADMPRPDLSKVTMPMCQEIFAPARNPEDDWPKSWSARTLIIAAGKKGILPTDDSSEDARTLAAIGQKENIETIAVTHAELRHPWLQQRPELFAQTVAAWIERRGISTGFVRL